MYNNIAVLMLQLTKTRKEMKHFTKTIDLASYHAVWLIRTDIKNMI